MKGFFIRLYNYFTDLRIKNKLLLLYWICGIVPMLLIGSITTYRMVSNMISTEKESLKAENTRVRNAFFNVIYVVTNISTTICNDSDLSSLLQKTYDDSNQLYRAYRNYTLIDELSGSYSELASINIYCSNPTLIEYGDFHPLSEKIQMTDWFSTVSSSTGEIFWIYDNSLQSDSSLHLVRRIRIPQTDFYAILMIDISDIFLRSMIATSSYHSFVCLDNNVVVFSNNITEQGIPPYFSLSGRQWNSDTYYTDYRGNRVLAFDRGLNTINSDCNFQIVSVSHYLDSIHRTLYSILLIFLIAMMIPLAIMILFSHTYSIRINTVRNEMHHIAQGDFQIIQSVNGKDELGELFHDMNATIQIIQQLNRNLFTQELQKKELQNQQQQIQYELLSSQVNPHFLFNTLESLRMQAAIDGQKELSLIIMELGKLLRYSLESNNTTVTLEHELNHLKSYFKIQHFRYQDKINYQIHAGPQILPEKIYVLPLILQPIVENAFQHGFSKMKANGMIVVNILKRGNNLIINIEDNGIGLSPERLQELQDSLNRNTDTHGKSIGMKNVHNRIRLFYGAEYGLSIASVLGEGTTVTLKLPLREDLENESIIS